MLPHATVLPRARTLGRLVHFVQNSFTTCGYVGWFPIAIISVSRAPSLAVALALTRALNLSLCIRLRMLVCVCVCVHGFICVCSSAVLVCVRESCACLCARGAHGRARLGWVVCVMRWGFGLQMDIVPGRRVDSNKPALRRHLKPLHAPSLVRVRR